MYTISFTPRGKREFVALPAQIQQRIQKKLRANARLKNPLVRAKSLVDLPPATHRFRVGKYRISFYISGKRINVERVELRGGAYRR